MVDQGSRAVIRLKSKPVFELWGLSGEVGGRKPDGQSRTYFETDASKGDDPWLQLAARRPFPRGWNLCHFERFYIRGECESK